MTDSSNCFQNILLATDFSDAAAVAVDSAARIARRCEAKLTIVHVVPDAVVSYAMLDYAEAGVGWAPPPDEMARLQKNLREGAEQQLRKLVLEMRTGGLDIETEVLVGVPYLSIVEAVKQKGHDLVVVGTRGMSAIKRVFVGSTATRLARACPAPVWIARSSLPEGPPTILAAVDFSPMSERIVSVSAAVAAALTAKLHVLHVYDTEELYGAPTISDEVRAEFSYYRRRARRNAFERLEQLLEAQSMDHGTATFHVSQGNPYQVINSTAKRLDVGLVVMGSVGRRGLSALLIGNTAEKVLHTSDRSLLVIKPVEVAAELPEDDEMSIARRELPVAAASVDRPHWKLD